jgi:hypothetical protein
MTRMSHPRGWRVVFAGGVGGACLALGVLAAAADRPIAWLRSGYGTLERELNREAARGLRFAAASDGLPSCSIVAMQAPDKAGAKAEYRVVTDKDLPGALGGLVEQGFVPRGSARGLGLRHDVVFERTTPARPAGEWRLVEFEKVEDLQTALTEAAGEGFRAAMLVRPAFRSWPGLSERGMVLAQKAPGAAPLDVQVFMATKKNVDDLARDVATATSSGWQFDLLFAHARDGGAKGRRERAAVVLSKPRSGAAPAVPVTIERRASFGLLGDVVVGAAGYWDEVLVASTTGARRQAWASPVRLGARDVDCGPLGLGFRFDAPRDQVWSITRLVARPLSAEGDYEILVVSDQDMNIR